jgi:hypothetical protein
MVEKVREEPAERYQSCDELLAALDFARALGGRQGDAPAEDEKTRAAQPRRARAGSDRAAADAQCNAAGGEPGRRGTTRLWTGVLAGRRPRCWSSPRRAPFLFERYRAPARGRVPRTGWIAREGLRKVRARVATAAAFFAREARARRRGRPRGTRGGRGCRPDLRPLLPFPPGGREQDRTDLGRALDRRPQARHVIFDPRCRRRMTSSLFNSAGATARGCELSMGSTPSTSGSTVTHRTPTIR